MLSCFQGRSNKATINHINHNHNDGTFDQLNDHVLSEILRNLCDTRDYLSCEKVNKAFKSALSHDRLWGYIALERELEQKFRLTTNSKLVDPEDVNPDDEYDFGNLKRYQSRWRDVVCCQQVLEYIRKEQSGKAEDEANGARPHEFVHRFDRARDWCPVAFQRDLVLDIYRKCIAGNVFQSRLGPSAISRAWHVDEIGQIRLGWEVARSELILRQDSLYVLLNIVSNHIVEHLKDAHLVERSFPHFSIKYRSKDTLDASHLTTTEFIRSKHENWASFREDPWEISTPPNIPAGLDVIVRKLAHRAGVMCMTEGAFGYTRRLFCNYVHALLHYSCILCVHGLDEKDVVQQKCTCSSDSCEHVKVVPLKPLPNMIQEAERILHEKWSGTGKVMELRKKRKQNMMSNLMTLTTTLSSPWTRSLFRVKVSAMMAMNLYSEKLTIPTLMLVMLVKN